MAKARQIVGILEDDSGDTPVHYLLTLTEEEGLHPKTASSAFHVQTRQSPYMDRFHGQQKVTPYLEMVQPSSYGSPSNPPNATTAWHAMVLRTLTTSQTH